MYKPYNNKPNTGSGQKFKWTMVVLEAPTFDGRPDPWTLINWLGEMDQFFDQIGLLEAMKVRFAKMK